MQYSLGVVLIECHIRTSVSLEVCCTLAAAVVVQINKIEIVEEKLPCSHLSLRYYRM